ncbi:unnamed protein product, partial [Brenthis ino]
MCVLLLNGMQKEDLDVSMLNKLHRHKVNIGDMNNEELLRGCTTIRALENQNNSFEATTVTNKENLNRENIDNVTMKNYDGSTANIKKESTTRDIIQYNDGQPEMQSVLKFWQEKVGIKVNMSNNTSRLEHNIDESLLKNEQKNKRNVESNTNYKETDTIQKILANLVVQRHEDNSVQSTTARESINGRKQYYYFPPTFYDNYRYSEYNDHKSPSSSNRVKQIDPYVGMRQIMEDSIDMSKVTAERNKSNVNLNDMLTVFNTFKSYYPVMANIKNNKMKNPVQDLHLSTEAITEKIFTTTAKITAPKIPQNMIKEIAISVKDMILSELRKEFIIITTTIPTTVATTSTEKETEYITTTSKTNHNIAETILKKITDLFKEIKSLKKNTLILSDDNNPENKPAKGKIETQWPPSLNNMGLSEQIFNNFGFNQYTNQKPPPMFKFSPQVHKYRSYGDPKPVHRVVKPAHLITVQTNNMEIPPLGIPIDVPENPINQNIIVTTTSYRIGPSRIESNLKFESSLGIEDYILKQKPLTNPFIDTPEYYSNFQPDYPNGGQLPLNKNSRTNYNANYKIKTPVNFKKPNNFHRAKTLIPFHEKLENDNSYIDMSGPRQHTGRIDCCNERYSYSKQMIECCNKKIASRQQMSLSNVKKQAPDDTHFNNFLKSQQKVTDMLERILATKNRVQGVEIA